MRNALFFVFYWLTTAIFAIVCFILALLPGKRPLSFGLWLYGTAMIVVMRRVAGIKIRVKGRRNIPREPSVIAAKHQSWGDGFVMLATIEHLGFVAGDHLYKFPLVGRILKKAGAIVLSNEGGKAARQLMDEGIKSTHNERRHVLIYPEGHLSAPGEKHRYRRGVWQLYSRLERPCVPVATSLGLAWDRQDYEKTPGTVTVEFLPPIAPGLDKDAFMKTLERVIETRTNELVEEGLK